MSEPKLNIKEESSAKKTRSPPKKTKVEQSVPRKKKLKTDAEKTAEKNQHLRFGKAELTPDELSRLSKAQKREMYAAHAARSAVHWSFSGAGTAQCLRCQVRQVEYRRFAHSAGKVAVSCVCVHQKAIRHPAKTDAPPGCGERDLRYGCRVVRLGDSRERKKRPHLVKNQISKSLKELFK